MLRIPLVAALIGAFLLSACANPFAAFAPDETEVVRHGWLDPAPRPELAERYCYRTLAHVDCHASPLEEEDGRQIGWFDAPIAK